MISQMTIDTEMSRTDGVARPQSRDCRRHQRGIRHYRKVCSASPIRLGASTVHWNIDWGCGGNPSHSGSLAQRTESRILPQRSAAPVAGRATSPGLSGRACTDQPYAEGVFEASAICERAAASQIAIPRRARGEQGAVLRSWSSHQSLFQDKDRAL